MRVEAEPRVARIRGLVRVLQRRARQRRQLPRRGLELHRPLRLLLAGPHRLGARGLQRPSARLLRARDRVRQRRRRPALEVAQEVGRRRRVEGEECGLLRAVHRAPDGPRRGRGRRRGLLVALPNVVALALVVGRRGLARGRGRLAARLQHLDGQHRDGLRLLLLLRMRVRLGGVAAEGRPQEVGQRELLGGRAADERGLDGYHRGAAG